MVAVSRGRTTHPQRNRADSTGLSRIIGFTCVAGFVSDIAIAAMPVALKSEQWRMNLLQQIGDRGIVLLFGLALLSISYASKRLWSKRIGLVSLIVGIFFLLSCLAFVRDSLALQEAASGSVDSKVTEFQTQIQEQINDPSFQGQVSPAQIKEATQRLNLQAEAYKRNVKTSTVRVGLSGLSNLLITGIAFLSLGRYCMQVRSAK